MKETNYSISQPQQRSPANAYSGGGEVDCLSYCKEIMFFVSRGKKSTSHKCHDLSLLNSCDDIFIIEPCLIEKDKENNNTDVKLIMRGRLSCLESRRCD